MILSLLALLYILPLLTILAMSFSSATAVAAGKVTTLAGRIYDDGISICD